MHDNFIYNRENYEQIIAIFFTALKNPQMNITSYQIWRDGVGTKIRSFPRPKYAGQCPQGYNAN